MNRKGHLGLSVFSLGVTQHFLMPIILTLENSILIFCCVVIGAKAPDLDFYFKYLYPKIHQSKRYLYHRQCTHSCLFAIALLWFSLHWQHPYAFYLFYFSIGLISHLLGDCLTGTIPILMTGSHYSYFRIGFKQAKIKAFFIFWGDAIYIPMILLGITLVFIPSNPIDLKFLIMTFPYLDLNE